jgi:hypothetical protein
MVFNMKKCARKSESILRRLFRLGDFEEAARVRTLDTWTVRA